MEAVLAVAPVSSDTAGDAAVGWGARGRSWRGEANRRGREAENREARHLRHSTAAEVAGPRRTKGAAAAAGSSVGAKGDLRVAHERGGRGGISADVFAEKPSDFPVIASRSLTAMKCGLRV